MEKPIRVGQKSAKECKCLLKKNNKLSSPVKGKIWTNYALQTVFKTPFHSF